jgi:hypothetical protein
MEGVAMSNLDKTWSIVADKMGEHWHCTVRRGQEGQRARLGELVFDLSDAENVKSQVEYVAVRIVVRTVSRLLEELHKDCLLRCEPGPALTDLAVKYDEAISAECKQLAVDHLLKQFGVRVDLAKVNG